MRDIRGGYLLQLHLERPKGQRFGWQTLYCPCGHPIPVHGWTGRPDGESPFCPGCGVRLSKVDLSVLDPAVDAF